MRSQVGQDRQTRVDGQPGDGCGQTARLYGGRGRIERHRAEVHTPVGGLLGELTTRDQVDLVSFVVRERELPRAVRLAANRSLDRFHRFGRAADIDVDPIAQRPWLIHLAEQDRRVPPHRIPEAVVTDRLVGERRTPERHHRIPAGINRKPHFL
jgi:hypothetical protein